MNALGKCDVRVYVISLPEAENRRAFMRFQLDSPGMPEWRFVDAVRGSSLTENEISEFYDEKSANPKLTRGEIGCAISHVDALKQVLSNEDEFAIILEDDAVLSTWFIDIFDKIKSFAREKQECVVIMNCAQIYFRFGRVRIGRYHYLHKINVVHGSQGYLVTRKSAKLLLDSRMPISRNADDWTHFNKFDQPDIRCVVPYCVGHGLIGRASHINHPNRKSPITSPLGRLRKRLVYNFGTRTVLEPVFGLKRQKMFF
jgi:glycosyl transferase, family 25